MAPKKVAEIPKEEVPPVEEEQEPDAPEILKKSLRSKGQLYYGDVKAGYGERKGTWLRHGFGRQVMSAISPAPGGFYETVVQSFYDGTWEDDLMSGNGVCKFCDGSSYEGDFKDGVFHGQGRFLWHDGSKYDGQWRDGAMNGQGRFDSRFDGSFLEGRFERNCIQKADGRWLDVLQLIRDQNENRVTGGGKPAMVGDETKLLPSIRRCSSDDELAAALATCRKEGLVPFVISDDTLGVKAGSALDCLERVGATLAASQAVNLRRVAVLRRRMKDFHGPFHRAMQESLKLGQYFVLAFEDDDAGCALGPDECEDWTRRGVPRGVPSSAIPTEWQLKGFFKAALPAEVFLPQLFNGRGRPDFFVERESVMMGADGAQDSDAAAVLAAGVASPLPASGTGLTGHVFSLDGAKPSDIGLPVMHQLRPAVVALGQLPGRISDAEVKSKVRDRFGRHVPLNLTAVVLISGGP